MGQPGTFFPQQKYSLRIVCFCFMILKAQGQKKKKKKVNPNQSNKDAIRK